MPEPLAEYTEIYQTPEVLQAEEERATALTDLNASVLYNNIAEQYDEKLLLKIGQTVFEWYEADENSRTEWKEKYEEYIALASQVVKKKTFPWKDAANVKYPLLTIAAMQFAARAYSALVPPTKVVKSRVIGEDPRGEKKEIAKRIERYMSYQVLEEIPDWEDSTDRLLLVLPIVGNAYKKTYYNGETVVSDLVLPDKLVVNYHAKSIESAARKTHVLYYSDNEIYEKVHSGEYLDLDYGTLSGFENSHTNVEDDVHGLVEPNVDEDTPKCFLECHCWWDMDEDGYKEPYIVTVHKDTMQVARIVARYDLDGIKRDADGKLIKIIPVEYFTNYRFIPDPNSGVYGLSFGIMLGPLNEATNTIINQLIDAGTLHNLQSGFVAKGLRMPRGDLPLRPGTFMEVNSSGIDIRNSILPLPTKEPSTVLFNLLGLLIESGQRVSATSNMLTGESPGQNQPFSTTDQVLRQGLQVYTSIFKRVHRAQKKEFKQIYRLNRLYLPAEKYFTVLDIGAAEDQVAKIKRMDFDDTKIDVLPQSDPEKDSDTETIQDMSLVMELLKIGTVNPAEATRRLLDARDIPDMKALLELPDPQPNFDQQIKIKQNELKEKEIEIMSARGQYQAERDKANADALYAKTEMEKSRLELEKTQIMMEMQMQKMEKMSEERIKQMDVIIQTLKVQQEEIKTQNLKKKGEIDARQGGVAQS